MAANFRSPQGSRLSHQMGGVVDWLDIRLTQALGFLLLPWAAGSLAFSIFDPYAPWSNATLLALFGCIALSVILRGYWRLELLWQPTVALFALFLSSAAFLATTTLSAMSPWIALTLDVIPMLVAFVIWYMIVSTRLWWPEDWLDHESDSSIVGGS